MPTKYHRLFFLFALGSSVSKSLKTSFGLFPSFFHFIHVHAQTHTHTHHAPDNHQVQGTLYCFSSMLITSGLDPRFSQRAAKGDGVYANVCVCVCEEREVCVLGEGLAGWRGHCCCQSIVTLDIISQYNPGGETQQHNETNQPDLLINL